ncbi:MAG: hypothetical protein ACE5JG_11675 [Planctomycetota bacterium]
MSQEEYRERLERTRQAAHRLGLDLRDGALLACFEVPVLHSCIGDREILALARLPGVAVAAVSPHALSEARRQVAGAPRLHVVAEWGLVCGLSGGAVVHVYPNRREELVSFAVALFASAAPEELPFALGDFASPGRQEVTFVCGTASRRAAGPRDLLHAARNRDIFAHPSGDGAIVVDDAPATLDAVREVLTRDLPRTAVLARRMPSGRFRFSTAVSPVPAEAGRLRALAQGIALSSDRHWEQRGEAFTFATEEVAQGVFDVARGVGRLAEEVFGTPQAALAFYGPEPLSGAGVLNFRPVIEVPSDLGPTGEQEQDPSIVEVRDVLEFVRILCEIRLGG